MHKIIRAVAKEFQDSEMGRDALKQYIDLKKHPGWKTHQTFLIEFGNRISNEVLTGKFQSLEPNEKLVRLEAYSKVSEVIRFLLNPIATFQQTAKVKQHNIKMGATQGKRPEGV